VLFGLLYVEEEVRIDNVHAVWVFFFHAVCYDRLD